jgi:hypothetical protein
MFERASSVPTYGPPSTPLSRLVRRRRFFLGSLAVHVMAFLAISQWHSDAVVDATVQANSSRIQASTQAAQRHGMRRQVDSLKAMKELMERIDRAQQAGDPLTADTADDPAKENQAPTPPAARKDPVAQTPQEMLDQARTLRDSIQKIELAARAKEMARLLKISPQDALEQLQQQAQEKAKAAPTRDASQPLTDEQVAQTLAGYEQQARESLHSRQQLSEHQANGTPLGKAGAPGSASQAAPGDKAAAGQASQGGTGSVEGPAGRNGAAGGGQADHRRSGVIDLNPRRYDAPLPPIALDIAKLRLGYGNVLGSGGAFANRVVVDQWYVIGPFSAPDPGSMQKVYPPEMLVDLDAVYLGKGRRVLRWQYLSSAPYPLIPPDEAEQAMYYGYTELNSDKARDVYMAFGADDDARAWVNEKLVWSSGNQAKRWYTRGGVMSLKGDIQTANLIEERRLVHLRKGRNTILFKLYNNPLDVFFSLVLEPGPEPG